MRRSFGKIGNAIAHSLYRRKSGLRAKLALGYVETFDSEMQKLSDLTGDNTQSNKCPAASVMFLLAMY